MLKVLILLNLLFCGLVHNHVFDEKIFLDNLKQNTVIQQLYYPHLNSTLYLIDYILNDPISSISDQCAIDFNQIKNGLLMKDRWALLYYESNGFPKDGRLNGDYNNLGYYDQCLSIGEKEMKVEKSIETKFCLISISTPEWNQLVATEQFSNYFDQLKDSTKEMYKFNLGKVFGVCLPSSCRTESVLKSMNRILLPLGLNATSQQYCSTKQSISDEPFTYTQIFAMLLLSCSTLLCMLSYFFKDNSFLIHFSISKNYNRVYDYDTSDLKTRSTDYLHGLKSVVIACSILLHCFGIIIIQTPFLFSKIRYYHAGTIQIILDRAFLFADLLFFYGGFFAMFSWYDSLKRMNVTPYRYVFTRFIRVFVVSVMVILLTFLMPLISNGPYYKDLMAKCTSNCLQNFWKNLLLINNHGSFTEICFIPTWYFAADWQLYLANYFLITFLVKKPKFGLWLAAAEIFICSLFIIVYDYLKDIPYYYTLTSSVSSLSTFKLEKHYLPTFYHSNTFVIGILTAWVIKSELKFKFLENQLTRVTITLTTVFCILTAMSFPELWERKILPKNSLLIIIWSIIDKFLLTAPVAWSFYAIKMDYYVTLKKLVTMRCWVPISQISFSMIMCQFFYFYYLTGTQKTLYSFDLSNLLKEFVFTFTLTFILSNVTYLLFEMPVTNVLMKLFGLNRRRDLIVADNGNVKCTKLKNDSQYTRRFDKLDKLDIQYDYSEINNNNPDFEPIKKLD